MKPVNPRILTINGGSSSIKFALFEAGDLLQRILEGEIMRIGLTESAFRVKGLNQTDNFSQPVTASNHKVAVDILMDWIEECIGRDTLTAVGHRLVHGGPKYNEPQRITAEMVEELHRLSPFDPEHLPEEILLTEAFHHRYPDLPQWDESKVFVNLPRETIRQSPEYTEESLPTRDYEIRLHRHYNRQIYWND